MLYISIYDLSYLPERWSVIYRQNPLSGWFQWLCHRGDFWVSAPSLSPCLRPRTRPRPVVLLPHLFDLSRAEIVFRAVAVKIRTFTACAAVPCSHSLFGGGKKRRRFVGNGRVNHIQLFLNGTDPTVLGVGIWSDVWSILSCWGGREKLVVCDLETYLSKNIQPETCAHRGSKNNLTCADQALLVTPRLSQFCSDQSEKYQCYCLPAS